MSKVSNEKDTDTNNDVFSKVNNLYKKAGYLNIYGIDLIISIVIDLSEVIDSEVNFLTKISKSIAVFLYLECFNFFMPIHSPFHINIV